MSVYKNNQRLKDLLKTVSCEVHEAIGKLKNNTASGIKGIQTDRLKHRSKEFLLYKNFSAQDGLKEI
jgi:hypothetical protein